FLRSVGAADEDRGGPGAMTPMRVIDTGLRCARWNIAMTVALAELHRAGRIPDTAHFHRYPASVLIGRRQNLDRVLRRDRARRADVEIARRGIGDDTLCMWPGQLALNIVAERRLFGDCRGEIDALFCNGMADGLSRLGLPARLRPRAEVQITGRKIAQASCSIEGSTIVCQGVVLLDLAGAEEPEALLRSKPIGGNGF